MILETVFTLLAIFKPVHVMDTPEKTCGAADRLMKEKVKLETSPRELRINRMPWELLDWDANAEDWDTANWVAVYRVRPDQYMSMRLEFNEREAWLTLEGIDAKREPCRDMIYLKRAR